MYQNTWRHVTKDCFLNIHHREFLETYYRVQCPNFSSHGSSAMASRVFFLHSLQCFAAMLYFSAGNHLMTPFPHFFFTCIRGSPAGPLPPRLQLHFRNHSALRGSVVNPTRKSERGGQRFKFTTLGQQNALTYYLDIYITMSHWIFLHFAVSKWPSLGN